MYIRGETKNWNLKLKTGHTTRLHIEIPSPQEKKKPDPAHTTQSTQKLLATCQIKNNIWDYWQ
jgi:hypothetical protein